MNDSERRLALGNFLRDLRASVSPLDVGLLPGNRRRTRGLRREEVAGIANIGLSWYTRLEQGRDIRPSVGVLESLASALQLTPNERRHLFLLAGESLPPQSTIIEEKLSPSIQDMLNELHPNPAYVIGKKWDFLAWNEAADAVFMIHRVSPPHDYNLMWRQFTDSIWKEGSEDWESVSRRMIAEFRTARARYLNDDSFDKLIEDLKRTSDDFTRMWQYHEVPVSLDGYKKLLHPTFGVIEFEHVTLQFPNEPDQRMMIYMPHPATKSRLELWFTGASGQA
ncbi:helix-turn-helix transcriptional regulator [Paenibacillus polysaccharolyticus]|uniref:helix-turn-helix transcriptional regulator n=1 Tax=Paenibacillus polysaccharolyticus TaxID=582692 RepID=UPI0020A068CD|nr:helix-turn-helix transcriptional regulator [Paenibacillus polysaccharolyticus]MCP1132519.1 helix-turn-helix transcriptional regulator [Paenibacillus polysaccharolyticus]